VHDCRHTYASRLVTAGVSLARVQYLLGHESITTTQRYSHLQDDGHDEVRAALAGSRNPPAPFLPHDLVADQ
jgi:site-specific recombinase XerD